MACYVFVRLNGYRLTALEPAAVGVVRDLAAGKITERELAAWFKANSVRVVDRPRSRKKS